MNNRQPRVGSNSPWGTIDHVEVLGDGIITASTPSHGGIWVRPDLRTAIPVCVRETNYSHNGWFEEDCDAAIPLWFLRDRLNHKNPDQAASARKILATYHPASLA